MFKFRNVTKEVWNLKYFNSEIKQNFQQSWWFCEFNLVFCIGFVSSFYSLSSDTSKVWVYNKYVTSWVYGYQIESILNYLRVEIVQSLLRHLLLVGQLFQRRSQSVELALQAVTLGRFQTDLFNKKNVLG